MVVGGEPLQYDIPFVKIRYYYYYYYYYFYYYYYHYSSPPSSSPSSSSCSHHYSPLQTTNTLPPSLPSLPTDMKPD